MIKKTQRTNNLSLKLSDDEKRRVTFLASQRDLSVAEYLRMSALGHRIKPTVIEFDRQEEKDDPDMDRILSLIVEIAPHIEGNGYLNYKNGGKQLLEMKQILKKKNLYTEFTMTYEEAIEEIEE